MDIRSDSKRGSVGVALWPGGTPPCPASTAGLLLNNVAAIGAMCVAPFMLPSRAVCIGVIFRMRRVFIGGLVKQLLGMLVISVSVTAFVTVALRLSVSGITITPEILLRAMPTTRDVALNALIALSAGAAASIALVTQPQIIETSWGQVVDAIIGVEIAIALVPPAAVIGIGLALGSPAPMWTNESRSLYDRSKLRYPSDLTDEEWALIEPLIPPANRGRGKRTVDMRDDSCEPAAQGQHYGKERLRSDKRLRMRSGFKLGKTSPDNSFTFEWTSDIGLAFRSG